MGIVREHIRGLETAWLEQGLPQNEVSPIFFFIHGFPDTPETYRHQLEHFGKEHLIVAPFARGLEGSELTTDPARYNTNAVLLDHLSILSKVDPDHQRPVVVVGHDVGALYAWNLAQALKNRARALVIINSGTFQVMAKRFLSARQLFKSWYVFVFQIPVFSDWICGCL